MRLEEDQVERTRPLAHERLAHWAARTPDAIAVEAPDGTRTYRELDECAERVARHLRHQGVGPGVLVGLGLPRSADLMVGIFAVLKAGGAYLPLDPAYPRERLAFLIEDAKPHLVLTQGASGASFATTGVPTVDLAALIAAPAPLVALQDAARGPGARDLAYVIYTSGSTGRPKGVCIEHGSLAHRIETQASHFPARPGDRVLQFASMNFDASVLEVTLALCHGATLCIGAPDAVIPGEPLARFLEERAITCALLMPSVLANLPEAHLPRLRLLLSGGEACHARIVDRWAPGRRFINLYGPTEATIWATTEDCAPGHEPTIGHPIPGVTVHLLCPDNLQPVAPGEPGELCLGGEGLARGYLHRPDLTAERFPEGPTVPGGRLYRTGDLARRLPDGRIVLLGRMDRQVKVRGVRIELDEVEAVLARHPGVKEVAVELDRDPRGDARLVAYLVPRDAAPTPLPCHASEGIRRDLRTFLSARVVDAMVPAVYVLMPILPLTPNGKVDRKALPAPAAVPEPNDLQPPSGVPTTPLEGIVRETWAEVLKLDPAAVGLHTTFFDLGGHSLLVAQVQERLQRRLGREVPTVVLYEHGTVAALARRLQGDAPADDLHESATRGTERRAALSRRAARRPSRSPDEEDPDAF